MQPELVIAAFVALARRHPDVRKVALFGSRARGDARPRSDYDLALWAEHMPADARARFELTWSEQKPTLLGTDLVWCDEPLPAALSASIAADGRVIYERGE